LIFADAFYAADLIFDFAVADDSCHAAFRAAIIAAADAAYDSC